MNNLLSFEDNFYPPSNYSAERNLIPKAYRQGFLRLVDVNIKFTNAINKLMGKENLKKESLDEYIRNFNESLSKNLVIL